MSFLALSLSRKISYAKNFVLLPPEIPGGRYNLLLIAVNQIFYHRFIGLLLKLHDLLLCHISRTGFILVGQWWKHFIFIIHRRPGSPLTCCHIHQRETYQVAQGDSVSEFVIFIVGHTVDFSAASYFPVCNISW